MYLGVHEWPTQIRDMETLDNSMYERDAAVLRMKKGGTTRIPYETAGDIRVISTTQYALTVYGVEIRPDQVIWAAPVTSDGGAGCRQLAIGVADILHSKYVYASIRRDEAAFAAGLTSRSATPKFTEAARRYSVQAQSMIEQKRFADAANLLSEALKISPYWADARYNRALVLGELKRYPEAIAEMRRYLRLEPSAPDKTANQDRIYRWEAAMQAEMRASKK